MKLALKEEFSLGTAWTRSSLWERTLAHLFPMLLWHLLSPLHFWVLIRPTQLWQLWQQGQLRPCAFRQSLLACDSLGILFEAEDYGEVMEVLWATCPWRSWKHLVTNSVEATERAHFRLRFDQIWLKLQQTRTHTHTYTHTETKCTATASAGRSIEWGKKRENPLGNVDSNENSISTPQSTT